MTPLSQRERSAVIRAAEMVASGEECFSWSCETLGYAGYKAGLLGLDDAYADFYRRECERPWQFDDGSWLQDHPNAREIRVLCLLWFATVASDREVRV